MLVDNKKKWTISEVSNLRIRGIKDRLRCEEALKINGIKNIDSFLFLDYLVNLKKSMFAVAPIGMGIDTFRLWECLYMKCVPICSKEELMGANKDLYRDIPILWIDSWEDFNKDNLSEDLYYKLWFDSDKINFDNWAKSIERAWIS